MKLEAKIRNQDHAEPYPGLPDDAIIIHKFDPGLDPQHGWVCSYDQQGNLLEEAPFSEKEWKNVFLAYDIETRKDNPNES